MADRAIVPGQPNPCFRGCPTPVAALSGGQRQSVAIARAARFLATPARLVTDEPIAVLGVQEARVVAELI